MGCFHQENILTSPITKIIFIKHTPTALYHGIGVPLGSTQGNTTILELALLIGKSCFYVVRISIYPFFFLVCSFVHFIQFIHSFLY